MDPVWGPEVAWEHPRGSWGVLRLQEFLGGSWGMSRAELGEFKGVGSVGSQLSIRDIAVV